MLAAGTRLLKGSLAGARQARSEVVGGITRFQTAFYSDVES